MTSWLGWALGAKVIFPDKEDAKLHDGEIIECSWDAKQEAWTYMRERRDKKTPNAWHVYEKVLQSIKDNITPGNLVDIIQGATRNNVIYAANSKAKGNPPSSKPSVKGNVPISKPSVKGNARSTQPNGSPPSTQLNGSAPNGASITSISWERTMSNKWIAPKSCLETLTVFRVPDIDGRFSRTFLKCTIKHTYHPFWSLFDWVLLGKNILWTGFADRHCYLPNWWSSTRGQQTSLEFRQCKFDFNRSISTRIYICTYACNHTHPYVSSERLDGKGNISK